MIEFDFSEFRSGPFTLMWQTTVSPAEPVTFSDPMTWQACIREFQLRTDPPHIVMAKYRRALTLYELSWFSYDVLKAAELAALVALDLALLNQYGASAKPNRKPRKKNDVVRASFSELLRHMVHKEGLTATSVPSIARHRVTDILPVLNNLSDIRNGLAHGDPFDGGHQVGLLELVRDLIDFAYSAPMVSKP